MVRRVVIASTNPSMNEDMKRDSVLPNPAPAVTAAESTCAVK